MKKSTLAKAGIGLAAVAVVGVSVLTPTAFAAPPTTEVPTENGQIVGVGSDTIQDVLYGISESLGGSAYAGSLLTSVPAFSDTGAGVPWTYRSGNASKIGAGTFAPQGSGGGYTALSESLGRVPLPATDDGVRPGDIDFSRASSARGAAKSDGGARTGIVTNIPFAIDLLAYAVLPSSPFLSTNDGDGLTLTDLFDIYNGNKKYIVTATDGDTEVGTLEATAGAADSGSDADFADKPIHAYLPKATSGSRQFFLAQLNTVGTLTDSHTNVISTGAGSGDAMFPGTDGRPTSGPYIGANDPSGSSDPTSWLAAGDVAEHNGAVLLHDASTFSGASVPIAPFSVAKFIGYHNGIVTDPSGSVAGTNYVLGAFDSAISGHGRTEPFTGAAPDPTTGTIGASTTIAPDPEYITYAKQGSGSFSRSVYNVLPTDVVTNPLRSLKQYAEYQIFVGKGSQICAASDSVVTTYGFLADPTCGTTTRTADDGSTATVTLVNPTKVDSTTKLPAELTDADKAKFKAGTAATLKFNVKSNGNKGGVITFTEGGVAYSVVVPEGSRETVAAASSTGVFTAAVKVAKLTGGPIAATFTPNLQGVAVSQLTGGVTVIGGVAQSVSAKATAPTVASNQSVLTITVKAGKIAPADLNGTVTVKFVPAAATAAEIAGSDGVLATTGGKKLTLTGTLVNGVLTLPAVTVAQLPAATNGKGDYKAYISITGNGSVAAYAEKAGPTIKFKPAV